MQSKDDKVGNKTINKEGKEGEKKREKKIEIDSQKKKNSPYCGFAYASKTIKLFFILVGKCAFFSRKTRF